MSDGDENAAARQRIYRWRDERARDSACTCEPIGFSESGEWRLKDGELVHSTGRFFSPSARAPRPRTPRWTVCASPSSC